MGRNVVFLLLGALIVGVAVLGYQQYEEQKQPQGLQINLGKDGVEIKGK